MGERIKEKRFEIFCIGIAFLGFFLNINNGLMETPIETWMDQIPLIEKWFEKTLTLSDLVSCYSEHGMLGSNLLMLLNTRLFHFSTVAETYMNTFMVLVMAAVVLRAMGKDFAASGAERSAAYRIGFILSCLIAFSILQSVWGGMSTQVRLGYFFCVIALYMQDRVMHEKKSTAYYLLTIGMMVLAINVFGTVYAFAALPMGCLIPAVEMLRERRIDRRKVGLIAGWVICFFAYFFEYGLIGRGAMQGSGLASAAGGLLVNPLHIIKSLVGYTGSFLLGYGALADGKISHGVYQLVGVIMLALVFFALYLFFKKKHYLRTWYPIFLLGYTYTVWFLVLVGRFSYVGSSWDWITSSWYFAHTKVGMIATIWLLSFNLSEACRDGENKNRKRLTQAATGLGLTFIFLCIGASTIMQLQRNPYEIAFTTRRLPYLFVENAEDMPVGENGETPLQNTLEVTMDALRIMKKYDLSLFRHYSYYKEYEGMQGPIQNSGGVYEDGWVSPNASYFLRTEGNDTVTIEGYYPGSIDGNQKLNITLDGNQAMEYTIDSAVFSVDIPVPKNERISMNILSEFEIEKENNDVRDLSFIMTNISLHD